MFNKGLQILNTAQNNSGDTNTIENNQCRLRFELVIPENKAGLELIVFCSMLDRFIVVSEEWQRNIWRDSKDLTQVR
jgi:hypothetical protein